MNIMELELVKFIKKNKNWEELLSKEPYGLKITRKDGFICFKYNQLVSDFKEPIVKEARGIILKEDNWKVVCFPFMKFFNIDEPLADKLDWNNIEVQEKIDGSLIKLWAEKCKDGTYNWRVSTNGTIDAFDAQLNTDIGDIQTFGQLFMSKFPMKTFQLLSPDYTYMFELVSPLNKIVIKYPDTKIYHIGTRNNKTYQEEEIDIGIEKPRKFDLKTENDIRYASSILKFDQEGYVVVDKNYKRVKVKSPEYLLAHRLINNNVITNKRVLELIQTKEDEEFLSYFPEYTDCFNVVRTKYNKFLLILEKQEKLIRDIMQKYSDEQEILSRKDFAFWVLSQDKIDKDFAFGLVDHKYCNYKDYIEKLSINKIIERIV